MAKITKSKIQGKGKGFMNMKEYEGIFVKFMWCLFSEDVS